MSTSRRLWFILLCLVLGAAVQADAITFTVNSTDSVADGTCDGTHCSLDDAIVAANTTPGRIPSSSTSCRAAGRTR